MRKLFAIVSNQGTAMAETVLNEQEFADPVLRAATERLAMAAGDASDPLQWADVSDNEACQSGMNY